jgi:hypothetical protein
MFYAPGRSKRLPGFENGMNRETSRMNSTFGAILEDLDELVTIQTRPPKTGMPGSRRAGFRTYQINQALDLSFLKLRVSLSFQHTRQFKTSLYFLDLWNVTCYSCFCKSHNKSRGYAV